MTVKKEHRQHYTSIREFLQHLNAQTNDYVLKGGTALLLCYGLDRFSEDIDLDGRVGTSLAATVESFCQKRGFTFRVAKDTQTVQRYMVNYGKDTHPLKIEASYRKKEIDDSEITTVNGICVYTIDRLCIMKANAYTARDKIRDLYDLTFICNHHWGALSQAAREISRDALEYKGLENFDYIVRTQADELVDVSKLAGDFLAMYDRLGLLYDAPEKELLDRTVQKARNVPQEKPSVLAGLKENQAGRSSNAGNSPASRRKGHDEPGK